MIKLDDNLLTEIGLGTLPKEEKSSFLKHMYETLEMRVGTRLAEKMSDAQMAEFEQFINSNDEQGAFRWLESNFPNYKEVVADEFEKLKGEIRPIAPQILASSQAQSTSHGQQDQALQPTPAPVSPVDPAQHVQYQQPQPPTTYGPAPMAAPSPSPAAYAPSVPDPTTYQPAQMQPAPQPQFSPQPQADPAAYAGQSQYAAGSMPTQPQTDVTQPSQYTPPAVHQLQSTAVNDVQDQPAQQQPPVQPQFAQPMAPPAYQPPVSVTAPQSPQQPPTAAPSFVPPTPFTPSPPADQPQPYPTPANNDSAPPHN